VGVVFYFHNRLQRGEAGYGRPFPQPARISSLTLSTSKLGALAALVANREQPPIPRATATIVSFRPRAGWLESAGNHAKALVSEDRLKELEPNRFR